jgi:thioredoxin reductase
MLTWQRLPSGTFLKSLGPATDVYLPGSRNNFVAYCRERGLEAVEPCSMHDFARFGIWTQEREVPGLETEEIMRVSQDGAFFEVTTSSGETFRARAVIIAVGLTHFAYVPKELGVLPAGYVTHTSEWSDYRALAGKEVCVIGGGASSLDAAAQLLDVGATPTLLVRDEYIGFTWKTPQHRSFWERIRRPNSALGFGLSGWMYEVFPSLLHFAPDSWRVHIHRTNFGPAGGWWLRDRVEGKVPLKTRCRVLGSEVRGGRLALTIRTQDQGEREFVCDHVIAGCGYRLDVDRLGFLHKDLRRAVRRIEQAPALDRHFESSVPGLFFVGPISSLSFGPLFRFVIGARHTSRVLSQVLARRAKRWAALPERMPHKVLATAEM